MKRVVGLVCLVLALAACQTTEGTKSPSQKTKLITSVRSLGWFVGYSEICNFHQGKSIDNRILTHFKKINENNDDFDAGYRLNSSLVGSDKVIGLNQCDYVNSSLKYSYKRYTNWVAEPDKTVPAERKTHIVSLEWEESNNRIAYETIVTEATKKHYISDYIEIEKGQFCKFEWKLDSTFQGSWKVSCDDGGSGKGIFDANGVSKIFSGYGQVSFPKFTQKNKSRKLDVILSPYVEKS